MSSAASSSAKRLRIFERRSELDSSQGQRASSFLSLTETPLPAGSRRALIFFAAAPAFFKLPFAAQANPTSAAAERLSLSSFECSSESVPSRPLSPKSANVLQAAAFSPSLRSFCAALFFIQAVKDSRSIFSSESFQPAFFAAAQTPAILVEAKKLSPAASSGQ